MSPQQHRPSRHLPPLATLIVVGVASLLLAALAPPSTTVVLSADADTTLYEAPAGDLANGSGNFLFGGRTRFFGVRRAVLFFDIASQVPPGATIEEVELNLEMTKTVAPGFNFDLHRLVNDWGEGASEAGGAEGGGTTPETGDATWIHRFFPGTDWGSPGGDFEPVASASTLVDSLGVYTWGSTPAMVANVQLWLDEPDENHGWLLLGTETPLLTTAKQFASRENPNDNGPRISVTYSGGALPPEEIPTLPSAGLVLLALALGLAALRRLS